MPEAIQANHGRNPDLYHAKGSVSGRFGVRLRELRHARNLTQTRMAARFGIDRSFISDVERGKKAPTLATLEVFAIGLNVSLSELLNDL